MPNSIAQTVQPNLVRRYRFFFTILFIFSVTPSVLRSQQVITFRPQFDDSPRPRNHLSLFRSLKRPRVGLVLSGGGARGAAQIGVIKAFEKHNLPIDMISATSMGAIVGGLYASGYTSAEIQDLALQTDWDKLLSFSDTQERANLPIDQKLIDDWSIFVVRFEKLQPVIPHAVSSGQRLTNFLSEEALQALYHPNPSFDDLKIAFRAITTDLISGRRITIKEGSLAEALRASSTVPLLFNPIERDSMQLIDGGLVTNIPVDVAQDAGCDVIVAVNSTSGLRNADELNAPWQTADQIMGIMMQLSNREQLKNADVTITPAIGRHLSSDFKGLDSLITLGFRSAEEQIDSIKYLYERSLAAMDSAASSGDDRLFSDVHIEFVGTGAPDSTILRIKNEGYSGSLSARQIRRHIRRLYESGTLRNVTVDVYPETRPVRVVYTLVPNPVLRQIEFVGNNLVPNDSLMGEFQPLFNRIIHRERLTEVFEDVLRLYRKRGYSLARITNTSLDEQNGTLRLEINEGVIEKIEVKGSQRAENSFVLREFGLREGDVFEIEKAKQGITNINSTRIFEYVYLEASFASQRPLLTIRLSEFPSQLIRFGMRVDDERKFQATFDIRDENFRGIGTDLGLRLAFGARNGYVNLEFKSNRLFSSVFTFSLGGFINVFNSYLYADDPKETRTNHWNRLRVGEYSDVRLGGRLAAGTRLGKLGSAVVEWSLQDSRIKNVENAQSLIEHSTLSLVTIGTVIDTRDRVPFTRSGVNFKLSYEFASKNFLSDVGYNALRFFYESYRSWGERSTFCPRIAFGFADVTMPLGQQFRLGGRQTMFGTREDDRRGRQMLSISLEYVYQLPIRFVFDPYVRVRYDLASIAEIPEQIKLNTFRHGIGIELAFDTPLGETALGAGKSFAIARNLPKTPIQEGPLLLYFTLGYEL